MLTMKDLPWPELGDEKVEVVLTDELLLDDSGFSNKPMQKARAGDTVTLRVLTNYGVVYHKVFGSFRY